MRVDWTVRAAEQPRPCPTCRCWTRPFRVVEGHNEVLAEFLCWGCGVEYRERYSRTFYDDPENRGRIPGGQRGGT